MERSGTGSGGGIGNALRRRFSVLLLWTGRLARQEAVILLFTAAAQALLFLASLRRHGEEGFENVLTGSHVALAALAGYVLLCLWVFLICSGTGSRGDYTLDRLGLRRGEVFFLHWLSMTAGFLCFWGAQTGAALGLCFLWSRLGPETLQSPQTFLLAFYRDSFFHALLPLADTVIYVRNLCFCAALGAAAATAARKPSPGFYCIALLGPLWFRAELLGPVKPVFDICVYLIVGIISVIYAFWRKGETDNDRPERETV